MILPALVSLAMIALVSSKVYERCELVRELSQPKHRIPPGDLATWVCIAEHESRYNTSAVGRLNADMSGDHGLFQISDRYWCSPPGSGLACGLNCDQLEDDDIADDVVCARRIYRAHKRRTGDGFAAWAVYKPHCSGDVSEYTECDDEITTDEADTQSK
ncbi:lysozyme P-like [Macrosteles quadrilineatus]|uniref:lysozyme P-like n=1 Tax=Macrosteles quadrilineatus TaxID=74068 RepID=UPI0023E0E28B|nr:lysozyme P-like [Macrosteles quadrilineatus]XP_054290800.1 lysozyme P-like [Macrosteles quadrilineatus]